MTPIDPTDDGSATADPSRDRSSEVVAATDLDRPSGWQVVRAKWGAVVIVALIVWYAGTQVFFPGQLRLTAPITCDAEHPDLFVTRQDVRRRVSRRTPSFENKVWCMSAGGDRVERSMLRAGLPLVPVYVIGTAAAVVAWHAAVKRRSAARADVVDAGDRSSTSASGPIS
jgi:hypothetical protein